MTSSLASPKPSSTVQRDHDVKPKYQLRYLQTGTRRTCLSCRTRFSLDQSGCTRSAFKSKLLASSVGCLTTVNRSTVNTH
jgi:hypothetical protein